jgi:hypothetical protein
MPHNPLPARLSSLAESIVNSFEQTDYQYVENIDAEAGIYDCDCNSFVGYILEQEAPIHYGLIPKEADQDRRRASEYYDFCISLSSTSGSGWHRIYLLEAARPGDIVAWRFAEIELGHDTGHVMFVAEMPIVDDAGIFSVRVYDSADQAHFDDTRGPGDTGVGSGVINFVVDSAGEPTAFLFAPGELFTTLPIAIARAEPLSS